MFSFSRKKYTLQFAKRYSDFKDDGSCRCINDSYIINTITSLMKKHNFEVVEVDLDCPYKLSRITIKCKRGEQHDIFRELCLQFAPFIERVTFK